MASSSTISGPSGDPNLFYPARDADAHDDACPSPPPSDQRPLLKDRLYVGNLHPSVDEYTLLQVFSKFGKVTKLDWLFHKTGLLKGKPRGYAFVEYANQEDALRALTTAHGKPLRGRALVVTFAHQAPLDQYGNGTGSGGAGRGRKTMMDVGRPTTLSMLKTGMGGRREGKTQDKIAMMEAKLRQMERSNPRPAASISLSDPTASASSASTSAIDPTNTENTASTSTLPTHPSLPLKPPPQIPGAPAPVALPLPPAMPLPPASLFPTNVHGSNTLFSKSKSNTGSGLKFPASGTSAVGGGSVAGGGGGGSGGSSGYGNGNAPQRAKPTKLVGVRIRPKDKEKDKEKEREKEKEKEKGKERIEDIEPTSDVDMEHDVNMV